MTTPHFSRTLSTKRIAAIALLRVRNVARTRILLTALVLALLPWAVVENTALISRLSALMTFTVAALTALAAGAIADDLDNGEYAIVVTHGTRPLEVLLGQAVAALGLTAVLLALQLPILLHGTVVPNVAAFLLCIASLSALLLGWLALMLFLATVLEGKANAVAMIAVLILPLALGPGVLDRIPRLPAAIVRAVLQLLPQVDHVTATFRTFLYRAPVPSTTSFALVFLPFFYFALAAIRLNRLQPAGRLTQ